MKIKGWKYYNNAAIPTTAPHELVNLHPIKDKTIWKMDGKPFFARWTDNFDCGYETEWWYCIKDEPFDFEQIKSKRRTEIRKGLKLNEVKVVKALDYVDQIYILQSKCFDEYPEQNKTNISYDKTKESCKNWDKKHFVYMAFSKETNQALGYAIVNPFDSYVNLESLKVPNEYQNSQVVPALIYNILIEILNKKKYKYICDGERNLVHQTNFMDYLVKQFAFRFAYCNLNIEYKPIIKPLIKVLFTFKKHLEIFSKNRLIYKIIAVLKMEEISRKKWRKS